MSKNFGESERRIRQLFYEGSGFILNGSRYVVLISGKPVCASGEPKTDVYILAEKCGTTERVELKISFKQANAEFLENKTTAERAEKLLGEDWQDIICSSTERIKKQFETKPLIFRKKYGKTERGAITLGWKFELLNVKSGKLSDEILLSSTQLLDVYSGTTLTYEKRNANVNGKIIIDSGVANYIMFDDIKAETREDVLHNLIRVEDYVKRNPTIYFACKALNYRTFKQKYDGNRPLAVYVDWSVKNGKLASTIRYDKPLLIGGTAVANKLFKAMSSLNISTTDDITPDKIIDSSKIYV